MRQREHGEVVAARRLVLRARVAVQGLGSGEIDRNTDAEVCVHGERMAPKPLLAHRALRGSGRRGLRHDCQDENAATHRHKCIR
jgi:hypothetical protein